MNMKVKSEEEHDQEHILQISNLWQAKKLLF